MPTLSLIAAVAQNGAIGLNNDLIYHLPNDLRRFKQLTIGHTIIMGRRTFESLPKGPLPQRRNIVISTTMHTYDSVEVYPSLSSALQACEGDDEIFIIGGAMLYAEALPLAVTLYLTHVADTPTQADVFFPHVDLTTYWQCVEKEVHATDERHPQAYTFATYKRKTL